MKRRRDDGYAGSARAARGQPRDAITPAISATGQEPLACVRVAGPLPTTQRDETKGLALRCARR
jgi:hypothetical protein